MAIMEKNQFKRDR